MQKPYLRMPVVNTLSLVHFINGWLNTQAGLLLHHLLGLSQGHFDGIGVDVDELHC